MSALPRSGGKSIDNYQLSIINYQLRPDRHLVGRIQTRAGGRALVTQLPDGTFQRRDRTEKVAIAHETQVADPEDFTFQMILSTG